MSRYFQLGAVLVVCLVLALAAAQARYLTTPAAYDSLPFEPAEELVYEGKLSRSPLPSMSIAELHFSFEHSTETAQKETSVAGGLHFTADAFSKGLLTKLFGFKFQEHIESFVDPTEFVPFRTVMRDQQGHRLRTSETIFDRSAHQIVWTERDPNDASRPARVVSTQFEGAVQDIASAIYFLRTKTLMPGKDVELQLTDSGRIYPIKVSVMDKSKMSTVMGKIHVLRIEPHLFGSGGLIQREGSISIWLTDDPRHIPVRAHVSTEFGSLEIKLKSISHGAALKH
jgi:hypothetical protein